VLTISGSGPMGDHNKTVDGISSGTPGWSKDSIEKVVIQEGVTRVGAKAFKNHTGLKEVALPSSLVSIGQDAFYGSGIVSIRLPEDLEEIEGQAFLSCTSLEGTVVIPRHVTAIPFYAFGKTSISALIIEGDLVTVGGNAFAGCTKLESVTFPDSVTTIGASAFSGCTALEKVALPNNEQFDIIGKQTFWGCASLSSIVIPDSVTTIDSSAFEGCSSLERVTLPAALTTIGSKAFFGASSLGGVYIPDTVTDVPTGTNSNNQIFRGMAQDSVIYLSSEAFVRLMLQSSGNLASASNGYTAANTALAVTNGGTFHDTTVFEAGKLACPIKDDLTFAGWYTKDEHGTFNDDAVAAPEKDRDPAYPIYYAKWYCDSAEKHSFDQGTTDPNDPTITHYACQKCDYVKADTVTSGSCQEHTWGEWEEKTEATCTENGIRERTCINQDCDAVESDSIPATGHDWDDGEVEQDATCTEDGLQTFTCSVCRLTQKEAIPALGHTAGAAVRANEVAPTYTDAGSYDLVVYCSVCRTELSRENVTVPKLEPVPVPDPELSYRDDDDDEPTYSVAVPGKIKHGDVTVRPKSAEKGDTVTITVKPDAGYEVDEVTVTDRKGGELKVKDKGDGKYTFTMPASKVEIDVTFVKEQTAPAVAFDDVSADAWYHDAAGYVAEKGLMSGTGNGMFSPGRDTSRAMIWVTLARIDSRDVSVQQGNWYEKAQAWAMARGLTDGSAPNGSVTREQLALMLYNYAELKGYDTDSDGVLRNYKDAASVSPWAVEALDWAVSHGLITGAGEGLLAPQATATRAQVAVILMNFCEDVAE